MIIQEQDIVVDTLLLLLMLEQRKKRRTLTLCLTLSLNYNHITIVGRIIRDPKISSSEHGNKKSEFHISVDRPYRLDDGTVENDHIPVVAWGMLAKVSEKYLKDGVPVLVEGRLQIKEYENNKLVAEVVAENFQILEKH